MKVGDLVKAQVRDGHEVHGEITRIYPEVGYYRFDVKSEDVDYALSYRWHEVRYLNSES